MRTAFRRNYFEASGLNRAMEHGFTGLWPTKTSIATVHKYWRNHRLVNSLGNINGQCWNGCAVKSSLFLLPSCKCFEISFRIKRFQMQAEVLITCSGVDGRTVDWELDLTALKQIQPLTGTKEHRLRFYFLQIKDKFIDTKPGREIRVKGRFVSYRCNLRR